MQVQFETLAAILLLELQERYDEVHEAFKTVKREDLVEFAEVLRILSDAAYEEATLRRTVQTIQLPC
jgi:hypothetical protein